jgi:two-component system OmpR family sensor kinase
VSLRARLLLVLAALALAGLIAADVATYAALRSFLIDRTDRSLSADARTLDRSVPRIALGDPAQFDQLASLTPGVFIELRGGDGRRLFSGSLDRGDLQPAVPQIPATLRLSPDEASQFSVDAQRGGTDFRVRVESLPLGGALILAVPLDDVAATLNRLLLIELLVSLAAVAAIVALGLWLVRLGLRPLGGIERTAAAIGAGDLGRRVQNADERTEVGRLGIALNAMLVQIERAFGERAATERRLRRFVADASHELRTPLASLRAYAELFRRGARTRPDDLERAMSGIEREATRMGVLVEDLVLLARLEGERSLERVPVDLTRLAADAVDAARAVEPGRRIELAAPPELVLTGDPDRLRQVLDNLLANVRAHTPVSAAASVRIESEDGLAVIEVADEGEGLDGEKAARVFERFYRADPSRSRDSGGSGLGLAIVAAIAEAHGGSVTVASAPGHGSTFRMLLPLVERSTSSAARRSGRDGPARSGEDGPGRNREVGPARAL